MSRYHTFLVTLALLSLSACAQKEQTRLQTQIPLKTVSASVENDQAKLDAYALIAMDAYERRDFTTASIFFEKLYDIDPQKEYLIDAIKAASVSKDYDRIKHLIEKAKGNLGNDKFINRYLVAYYLDKGDIPKAKEVVDKLLKDKPDAKDYELSALIASAEGKNDEAKKAYQKAYRLSHDPKVAIALAKIAFNEGKSEEAIRLLETHMRIYGCEKELCSLLVKIYTDKQDLGALEAVYKKLYRTTEDPLFAKALLELYAYEKNYDAAIAFLEKHPLSDETLLDIYTANKNYDKAYKLAQKLYKETGDAGFLARAAILEYESQKHKSKKLLKSVLDKFEKSVYAADDPLFYNYYAYLLIDHDIDIEKGLELVKKALQKEPDSLFYIDTLAWGYYKLGKCEDAYKLLQPFEKRKNQEEIEEHIEKIKQCIKDKKQ